MATRTRRHLARGTAGALAAVTLMAIAGSATASAAPMFRIHVQTGSCYAGVEGGPVGTFVTVDQMIGSTVVQSLVDTTDGTGAKSVCFADPWDAGMTVRARINSTTRTLTIPKLVFTVNRATDVISGTGPKGQAVQIDVTHEPTLNYADGVDVKVNRTFSSTGKMSVDLTAKVNITGRDMFDATVVNSNGDKVIHQQWVPQVEVRIGSPRFTTMSAVGQTGTVTLKSSAGTVRAKGSVAAGDSEDFYGIFLSSGSPVRLRVGDKVASTSGLGSAAFTVPNLTAVGNSSTDVVSGACPAGKRLSVEVFSPSDSRRGEVFGTCSAAGKYSISVATATLQAGDRLWVTVRLGSGDTVVRTAFSG